MRTVHLNDEDCFIVIKPDMTVLINVPTELPDNEVPLHSKYTVALTHLIHEGNELLDYVVCEKWNVLVDHYKLGEDNDRTE